MFEKSWERRIIIILNDNDCDELEQNEEGLEVLRNPEITVLPISKIHEFSKVLRLTGSTDPRPGMVMIISPFDNHAYYELSAARNLVAQDKMAVTLRTSQLLGSKSVKTTNIRIYDKETNKNLTLDVESDEYKGKLTSQKKEIESLRNKIQLNATFAGGKTNIEQAKSYLKQRNMDADIFLNYLIDMRSDEEGSSNKLEVVRQQISLTESMQNEFDFLATVDIPVIKINLNYKKKVKEKIEISSDIEIKF